MKKIIKICALFLTVWGLAACEMDNYDAPDATVQGKFINKVTGQPLEASQGQGNMKLRIKEVSYAHGDETVVVTEQNLNVMQDGTFLNTRLFGGTYEMWPFESCCYESTQAKQTVELKSGKTTDIEFQVTPYFEVEWVGEPYQDAAGYVCAQFKFKNNPLPDDTYTKAVVDKAKLFISTSIKCGDNSDSRYTDNDMTVAAIDEGNTLTVKTKIAIDFSQKFSVRIGVKPANNSSKGVLDKYCFSSIKTIDAKGK